MRARSKAARVEATRHKASVGHYRRRDERDGVEVKVQCHAFPMLHHTHANLVEFGLLRAKGVSACLVVWRVG